MSETTRSDGTAYFDTNIWVGFVLSKKDHNFVFANRLVNEMRNGKYCVYVSDLVLLETISSLRRKIPAKMKITAEPKTKVEKKIKKKTYEYMAILQTYQNEGKIINKNPPMTIEDLHKTGSVIMG